MLSKLNKVKRYAIWVELLGEAPEIAFHWRGSWGDGLAKAKAEAKERGLDVVRLWAEPLATGGAA
jgi:hypothetical protein